LFLGFLATCIAETRIFTDRQGRTVQAEKVGVNGANVILRLTTGSTITVSVTQLSEADQAWLREANTPIADAPASPVIWDCEAKPRGIAGLQTARFRVWIPDGAKPVRGMIALVPGSNQDGRGDANAGDWQALATELGFGLVACQFDSGSKDQIGYCYAAQGSGKLLLEALQQFAKAKNRPEVTQAPLLLWGHSAGGQFNYNFACWKPERTLAFIVNQGAGGYDTPLNSQTRFIPAILFVGEKDTDERRRSITSLFLNSRSRGALWALCVEKGVGHAVGPSRGIAQQFFRAVVRQRLSGSSPKIPIFSEGVVASEGGAVVPASQYKGSLRDVSWLPDAETAALWKAAQP
jgi:pimeloyl-ACP methyl ester carboxylesterase